jgi:hypothetical protein
MDIESQKSKIQKLKDDRHPEQNSLCNEME